MAEPAKIKVEFRVDRGLTIPEDISVPLHTQIEWEITDMNVNQSTRRFAGKGLEFHIYFPQSTPFNWYNQSTRMDYTRPISSGGQAFQLAPKQQLLALGVAEEVGDFKYGIRVTDGSNGQELYDEDPWIHVY
jgi:hypothetical protein